MFADFEEYLEEVNQLAIEYYEQGEEELLNRLEATVRYVCIHEGIDITLEDYDTG